MSIGSDLVGEVIALLQPLCDSFDINVREYGGELDDKDKEGYLLPTVLYIGPGTDPVTTVLVEYGGVQFKPRDTSHLIYLNTYAVNVWVVAGYRYSTSHLEGGDPLTQTEGLELGDAVLDRLVGRRLRADAERCKLVKMQRLFFGTETSDPLSARFVENDRSAQVWKLELSVEAESVWEEPPGLPGELWLSAAGELREEGGFAVDAEALINPGLVDFEERAVQPLPVDRADWRSLLSGLPFPTALFSCADALGSPDALVDVVDGRVLSASGTAALHRRAAAGLYGLDWRQRVCFDPERALELVGADTAFVAGGGGVLDPVDGAGPVSIAGFVVARLRPGIASDALLLGKWETAGEPGWRLWVEAATGHVKLDIVLASSPSNEPLSCTVPEDHTGEAWVGILFTVVFDASGVLVHLRTPLGTDEDSSATLGSLSNPDALFALGAGGGMSAAPGQLALATYWQGDRVASLDSDAVYRRLWRGPVHPVDIAVLPGLVITRDGIVAHTVGYRLGSGESVAKLISLPAGSPEGLVVSQDPVGYYQGARRLPLDRTRENALVVSEDLTDAAWLWTGVAPPTGPEATGPDGLLSAWVVPANAQIASTGSPSIAGPWDLTFSIWARSESGASATLAVGTGSTTIHPTRAWKRYFVTATSQASASVSVTVAGDDDATVEVWGPQLEVGLQPSAYVPTAGAATEVSHVDSYVDWSVLSGPLAQRGRVQISLLPGAELLAEAGEVGALEVTDGAGSFLALHGTLAHPGGVPQITWQLEGTLPSGSVSLTAPEAVPIALDRPLLVALAWYRSAVELWVDGERILRDESAKPCVFGSAPTKAHLGRCPSAGTPPEHWVGYCQEIRWWR